MEIKSGIDAKIIPDGEAAPLNGFPDYGLDLSKAKNIGYDFSHIDSHLYGLLDKHIAAATP